MARPLSSEKRLSLLMAASRAVAEQGVLATTSVIARDAGVAEGTLFTYFDTKDDLFQSLYLYLKQELAGSMMPGYPHAADIRVRLLHIFDSYVRWGLATPLARAAIARLSASGLLLSQTLARAGEPFLPVYNMMDEGVREGVLVEAPVSFLFAVIEDIADATIDYIDKHPEETERYRDLAGGIMWRAVTR